MNKVVEKHYGWNQEERMDRDVQHGQTSREWKETSREPTMRMERNERSEWTEMSKEI